MAKITSKNIAWLWMTLTRIYGHRFITHFGEKDDGIWLYALSDLTCDDLAYGIQKLLLEVETQQGEAWPPNLIEFRKLCEKSLSDFGLPTVHKAFAEMEKNQYLSTPFWSHPIICITVELLENSDDGRRDLLFRNFASVYDEVTKRYMECYLQASSRIGLNSSYENSNFLPQTTRSKIIGRYHNVNA